MLPMTATCFLVRSSSHMSSAITSEDYLPPRSDKHCAHKYKFNEFTQVTTIYRKSDLVILCMIVHMMPQLKLHEICFGNLWNVNYETCICGTSWPPESHFMEFWKCIPDIVCQTLMGLNHMGLGLGTLWPLMGVQKAA